MRETEFVGANCAAPKRRRKKLLTVAVAAATADATKQQRIPARETGRVTHSRIMGGSN